MLSLCNNMTTTTDNLAKKYTTIPIKYNEDIDIDEFGIPVAYAKTTTIPVIVSNSNFHAVTKCVQNGATLYPGATKVIQSSNCINLRLQPNYFSDKPLQLGMIVERHLQTGDLIRPQHCLDILLQCTRQSLIIRIIENDNSFQLNPIYRPINSTPIMNVDQETPQEESVMENLCIDLTNTSDEKRNC